MKFHIVIFITLMGMVASSFVTLDGLEGINIFMKFFSFFSTFFFVEIFGGGCFNYISCIFILLEALFFGLPLLGISPCHFPLFMMF